MEKVVLVDEKDNEIGVEEKMAAHRNGGKLHRAFSIFVFNSKGEMLIQKRACEKEICGGLWSNTCCSHPRMGEAMGQAARRRLREELGFECSLRKAFDFIYKAELENGFTEWEFDHVFIGRFDGNPVPNRAEVEDWKWAELEALKKDMAKRPEEYTPWFKIAVERVIRVILQPY